MIFFQILPAHQVINTLILVENTAAEQTKRKITAPWKATCVMEVRLALIVSAAKMMIMLTVNTQNVPIIKMQSKRIKVISTE